MKYVDSWVDERRARSSFARASASSWKPPSTMNRTASSVVIPCVWICTSMIALVTAPQVELPVDQPKRVVVAGVTRVHHLLGHVDRPALGGQARTGRRARARDGTRFA